MKASELKKGSWYIINNFGTDIRAKLTESAKQGRGYKTAVLMDVKGTDAGLFDEMGSVYVNDIKYEYPQQLHLLCQHLKKGEKL